MHATQSTFPHHKSTSENIVAKPLIFYVALSTYCLVSVLTTMVSPSLTKSGVLIMAPVSTFTCLFPPWAVLPLTDGGASTTLSSTFIGGSRPIIFVADVRKKRKKQQNDKNYESRLYFLHILYILPYLIRQRKLDRI